MLGKVGKVVSRGRHRFIAAAVIGAFSLASGLLAAPAQAKTVPPSKTSTLPQDIWSGYSAYPASGYVDNVEASWRIPLKVNCPPVGAPRVAVWVGMWGGLSSIRAKPQTAWLPQIGTVSQCSGPLRSDYAVWEIPGPKGNNQQVIPGMPVHPGDMIYASVELELTQPLDPNASVPRTFAFDIADNSDGASWSATETSGGGAALSTIARQAGAIVEDQPACSVLHIFDCQNLAALFGHGLAEYSPPVSFAGIYISQLGTAQSPWKYYEWIMKDTKSGKQLADNSRLTYKNGQGWSYSVKWLTQS
jgi:hypothetical protein